MAGGAEKNRHRVVVPVWRSIFLGGDRQPKGGEAGQSVRRQGAGVSPSCRALEEVRWKGNDRGDLADDDRASRRFYGQVTIRQLRSKRLLLDPSEFQNKVAIEVYNALKYEGTGLPPRRAI